MWHQFPTTGARRRCPRNGVRRIRPDRKTRGWAVEPDDSGGAVGRAATKEALLVRFPERSHGSAFVELRAVVECLGDGFAGPVGLDWATLLTTRGDTYCTKSGLNVSAIGFIVLFVV